MRHFAIKLTVLTLACFSISWIAAFASGINEMAAYPKSLFKTYGAVKLATGKVTAQKTFSGKDLEEVQIETTSTNVKIERSSTGFVEMNLTGEYPTSQEPLSTLLTGGRLTIKLNEVDVNNSFRFHINFDESQGGLHVRVPAGVKRVIVKSISGDVQAEQLEIKDLSVKTTSGDLNVERTKLTDFLFQSTSGDLHTERLEVQKFSGKTVSGDLTLYLENLAPMLEAQSTSGDIELNFRGEPSLKVDFSSVSGELDVEGPLNGTISKRGGSAFRIGDGKGGLSAKTVSGDLQIRRF